MSAYVEAWPCVGSVGPTEQLTGMSTFLADPYTPASVDGQVDQMWPWSGHSLDVGLPATQTDPCLPSQAVSTPSIVTESASTSSQHFKSSDTQQDDARQTPLSSHRSIRPFEPDNKAPLASPKPRRKMREHHDNSNIKKKPSRLDPQSVSQLPQVAANAKPKKRGRKPRVAPKPIVTPPQQPGHADAGEDFDDDDLDLYDIDEEDIPKDPRRRKTLERNRVAAKKCRVRKRDEASALASREQAVEDQNRYLSRCFNSATTEVYLLKSELLRHTHCNCTLIQEYIANEARRSVEKMNASPSHTQTYSQITPNHLDYKTRRSSYFDSESLELDSQINVDSPATESTGSAWKPAVQMGDANTAGYQHVFNHLHNHINDNMFERPPERSNAQQHAVSHGQPHGGRCDHASMYLAGYNDRATDQIFGHSFDPPLGFGPFLTEQE